MKLTYTASGNQDLICFVDSNLASDPDDKKSTAGYTALLAGGAI